MAIAIEPRRTKEATPAIKPIPITRYARRTPIELISRMLQQHSVATWRGSSVRLHQALAQQMMQLP